MFWRKKPEPVDVGKGYQVHFKKKSFWKDMKPVSILVVLGYQQII